MILNLIKLFGIELPWIIWLWVISAIIWIVLEILNFKDK
jgi:hypothetical protein